MIDPLGELRALRGLISYEGVATADGAIGGGTVVCSDLTLRPDYDGNLVVITSGTYIGQARDINGATNLGTVTPHTTFGGTILAGTEFLIVALRMTPAEVADIEAKLDNGTWGLAALKALIDAVEDKLDNGTWGLAALKALIDAVEAKLDAVLILTETGGTVTATGVEQNVYINENPIGEYYPRKVVIDLFDLDVAEVATIRTYYRIKDGGTKRLKDEVTFAGVQSEPMKNIELEPNRFGIAVTIEATAAVIFDWEVHYEG